MPDLSSLAATAITDGLLGWFAETTLVASVLAAAAALVARLRRLAPGPAARHVLWLMVLVKLVTPPVCHWPWSIPAPTAAVQPESPRSAPQPPRSMIEFQPDAPVAVADPSDDPIPEIGLPAPDQPKLTRTDGTLRLTLDPPAIASRHTLATWVVGFWLAGSVATAIVQGRRIHRFRRLLGDAAPAPEWLEDMAASIGLRLAVRVPPILVVSGLNTPVLWCLGRPLLLIPAGLLRTLEAGRWPSIVAHELAHLRRGDHWVRRLELAAGLIWWWNPLYWLARRRLDFEAELACDAWAIWADPTHRLTYAESLIRICTSLSPTGSPAPALGVAGTGRSFERRLMMILRDQVDRRVSVPGLLTSSLLAALALPSWSLAEPPQAKATPAVVALTRIASSPRMHFFLADDDDDKASEKKAKAKAEREKAPQESAELEKELEKKFGPESDFARKIDNLGKEMEKKFGPGSDFAKEMENLGKELEKKFGPGSDFAKEMEEKFGAGSDFARKITESIMGDDSDEEKPEPAKAKAAAAKVKAEAVKARLEASKARSEAAKTRQKAEAKARTEARTRTKTSPDAQVQRIEALESRIDELAAELKKLKAEQRPEDEDEDEDD